MTGHAKEKRTVLTVPLLAGFLAGGLFSVVGAAFVNGVLHHTAHD
ncbi:hypothetical protein [Vibrio parahaemolyticus]|nr:hypothetical protein [Vibrio parahaemolyticus]